MRNSTNVDSVIAPEEAMLRGVVTCRDAAIVVSRHKQVDHDAARNDAPLTKDEIESWAHYARAANGLGDFETAAGMRPPLSSSHELRRAALAHRSFALGEIVVAAFRAAGAMARRAYVRYRQHRRTRAVYDTLRELDGHTLRDLGFDRSEIRSVAAELTGEAERTRVRVLLSSYGFPK